MLSAQASSKQRSCPSVLGDLAAISTRSFARTVKPKIDFCPTLGAPCGDNSSAFLDEVATLTKLKAPLIGVAQWKDISEDLKNSLTQRVMVC